MRAIRCKPKLGGVEFVRRFLLHVLPKGIKRIRHYGLLAPNKAGSVALAREMLQMPQPRPGHSSQPRTSCSAWPRWTCIRARAVPRAGCIWWSCCKGARLYQRRVRVKTSSRWARDRHEGPVQTPGLG
jgi:hypothetical protein